MYYLRYYFLLSLALVVKVSAVDIVGIETTQFNAIIGALNASVMEQAEAKILLSDVEEYQEDINATVFHIDDDLHEIIQKLSDLNVSTGAVVSAVEDLGAGGISVSVNNDGVIDAIEALDLEGVIDAVDNGAVNIIAKNEQIKAEIMTNTAETALLRGEFGLFATSNLLQLGVINDGVFDLNNKLMTGNYIIPQPLEVDVVSGSVEIDVGSVTIDQNGTIAAVETLSDVLDDSNSTTNADDLHAIANQVTDMVAPVQVMMETALLPITNNIGAMPTQPVVDETGMGSFVIDVPQASGGVQSYDLFHASVFSDVPDIDTVGAWIKLVIGLYLIWLYIKYNKDNTIEFIKLLTTAQESNGMTNWGGSLGGVVNIFIKKFRISFIVLTLPVLFGMVALVQEVDLGGGSESALTSFASVADQVIGVTAPSWAQRAWQWFCVFVPVNTAWNLASTAAVTWLGIWMYALTTNRVLRVAS